MIRRPITTGFMPSSRAIIQSGRFQSAALLASLAPTSGHMVHMPGHIYYRVGNYAEAERWFSASMAADEHYMRSST